MESIFVLGEFHLCVESLTTLITLLRNVVVFLMVVVFVLFQSNLGFALVATYGTIIDFLFLFLGLIMVVIYMCIK